DGGAVRAGIAGRAAGQPGRDPVVEPGGGAAVAARHRAGGAARRGGRMGLARRGVVLRPVVAGDAVAGRQPFRPVVAAGGALVRAATGAAGRILVPAAARPSRQASGAAAVAAAAVA